MTATKRPKSRSTGRQKRPEAIGRDYARAIGKVFSHLPRVDFTESIRILRGIEAEHMVQLSNCPEFAFELRRRTAELSLEQALIHGCTQSQCRKKLAIAEELGWSMIDRKLHFHLIYARGMVARGHYRTAKAMAQRRIADVKQELEQIEKLPRRRGRKYFLDWLRLFNEIITETERSVQKGYASRWDAGGSFIRNHSQGNESSTSQIRESLDPLIQ